MGLDNYVPVSHRLEKARTEHKGLVVNSEVSINWEKESAFFKVTIEVEGKVVAMAHALAPALGDEKSFEKAETSAIGRALANMGYPAEDIEDAEPEKKSSSSKKGGGLGGLGSKKASKKEESKDEIEEEEETEEEVKEEQEEEKPAKKSGLPKIAAKKEKEEVVEEEEESEEESEEEEAEETEEEEAPPAKKTGGNTKLSGVMAKYGLKSKG